MRGGIGVPPAPVVGGPAPSAISSAPASGVAGMLREPLRARPTHFYLETDLVAAAKPADLRCRRYCHRLDTAEFQRLDDRPNPPAGLENRASACIVTKA